MATTQLYGGQWIREGSEFYSVLCFARIPAQLAHTHRPSIHMGGWRGGAAVWQMYRANFMGQLVS